MNNAPPLRYVNPQDFPIKTPLTGSEQLWVTAPTGDIKNYRLTLAQIANFVSAGGASTWGNISGGISNQTDLQIALNAKTNNTALAAVAFNGSYLALNNRPTFGSLAALSFPGGTTAYLRADGTWTVPPGTGTGGTGGTDSGLTDAQIIAAMDALLASMGLPAIGTGAWGGITGTLSAQTDLQAALDAKANRLPSVQTVVTAATLTPTFTNDLVVITAQAGALLIANPTGTAVNGKRLTIRIKDDGTARAITYGDQYRAIDLALPTTTTANYTAYLDMRYNADETKWDVVSVKPDFNTYLTTGGAVAPAPPAPAPSPTPTPSPPPPGPPPPAPAPSPGTIAVKQSKIQDGFAPITFDATTATGNLLVAFASNSGGAVTLADNKGNTFGAPTYTWTDGTASGKVWVLGSAIGGATHTITPTGLDPSSSFSVYEVEHSSGLDTGSYAAYTTAGATGTVTSPGALAQANNLVMTAVVPNMGGATETYAAATGYTVLTQEGDNNSFYTQATAAKRVTVTTAPSATWSSTPSTPTAMPCIIFALKEA